MVQGMGFEPTRPGGHKSLKLACLPVPPPLLISLTFVLAGAIIAKTKL